MNINLNVDVYGDKGKNNGGKRKNDISPKLGTVYPEILDPEKDKLLPQEKKKHDSSTSYGTIPEMAPENLPPEPKPYSATLQLVPVVLILGVSLGIYEPIIVELIKSRICEYNFNFTQAICLDLEEYNATDVTETTTKVTARLNLISGLISSVPCIFISLFMGSWSDNFGRKLPMIVPFLGFIVSAMVAFLAARYPLHPYIILLSPFCLALFGGWVVLLMAVFSCLTENTAPSNRSTAIAFIDGTLLIGKTAGILLGGRLLEDQGFQLPLFIYGILPIVAIVYIFLVIKERGVFAGKSNATCLSVFTVKNLMDNVDVLGKKRKNSGRKHMHLLLLSAILGMIFLGDQTVLQLISERPPLSWDVSTFTVFISGQNLAVGAALAFLVPLLKAFSFTDIIIAIISCISAILCSYGFAFSTTTWAMILAAAVGLFRNFHVVLARSMLIPMVEKDELGKLMTAFSTLQAISPLFQALFFSGFFALTVTWWPGFCFVVGSFAFVVSMGIFCHIDLERKDLP